MIQKWITIPGNSDRLTLAAAYFNQLDQDGTNLVLGNLVGVVLAFGTGVWKVHSLGRRGLNYIKD
ncbi:hypothetical protein HYW41_04670 [Candidatus Daviesbacteria bacterium]|nr:hypothetical protein [Candidatus Daviesbacteria bacterium]